MFVCPSVRPSAWNDSTPIGRIFMKFGISVSFENLSGKIQNSLKSDKNKDDFTGRRVQIYENVALNFSYNEKYFQQKLCKR